MAPRRLVICFALTMLAGPACDLAPAPPEPPAPPAVPQLLPRETFDWTGEPISFSIAPAGWRREGETSGGIKGVRFVKERSVGEAIGLGDYYILADRNRSAPLREILTKFDTYEIGFEWDRALRETYAYTDTPFTSLESEIAAAVNTAVSQAGAAFRNRDREAAKAHLEAALAEAHRLQFSLAEVINRVEFKPERRQEPERYTLIGRRETFIADEPAVIVDYTVTVPERARTYAAREAYVVHNSHLFICNFIGLQETLVVFDLMMDSIQFPNDRAVRGVTGRPGAVSRPESRAAGLQRELDLGSHRVEVSTPAGWELLDEGAQKRFRSRESEIVLQKLGPAVRRVAPGEVEPIRDLDRLAEWALAAFGDSGTRERREVKSRRAVTVSAREAVEIDTWSRLDHTWPQRWLFVPAGDDVIALHTSRLADEQTVKAFESIRDSLHVVLR